MNEKYLTRKELSTQFNVSVPTIRRWERLGKFPAIRLGGATVRYRLSDVEAFIANAAKQ